MRLQHRRRGRPYDHPALSSTTMMLGFQPEFVPQILAGRKVHTIRAGQRWAAGQPIHFYTSVGPNDRRKFRPDGVAQVVQVIRAAESHGTYLVEVDGRTLPGSELAEFARRDGFESPELLFHFLAGSHGLPFEGQLIHWTALRY